MRLLQIGANPLGRLISGRLKYGGADIAILADRDSCEQIRRKGINFKNEFSGAITHVVLPAFEHPETEGYDLILVTDSHLFKQVLDRLNESSADCLVFFINEDLYQVNSALANIEKACLLVFSKPFYAKGDVILYWNEEFDSRGEIIPMQIQWFKDKQDRKPYEAHFKSWGIPFIKVTNSESLIVEQRIRNILFTALFATHNWDYIEAGKDKDAMRDILGAAVEFDSLLKSLYKIQKKYYKSLASWRLFGLGRSRLINYFKRPEFFKYIIEYLWNKREADCNWVRKWADNRHIYLAQLPKFNFHFRCVQGESNP